MHRWPAVATVRRLVPCVARCRVRLPLAAHTHGLSTHDWGTRALSGSNRPGPGARHRQRRAEAVRESLLRIRDTPPDDVLGVVEVLGLDTMSAGQMVQALAVLGRRVPHGADAGHLSRDRSEVLQELGGDERFWLLLRAVTLKLQRHEDSSTSWWPATLSWLMASLRLCGVLAPHGSQRAFAHRHRAAVSSSVVMGGSDVAAGAGTVTQGLVVEQLFDVVVKQCRRALCHDKLTPTALATLAHGMHAVGLLPDRYPAAGAAWLDMAAACVRPYHGAQRPVAHGAADVAGLPPPEALVRQCDARALATLCNTLSIARVRQSPVYDVAAHSLCDRGQHLPAGYVGQLVSALGKIDYAGDQPLVRCVVDLFARRHAEFDMAALSPLCMGMVLLGGFTAELSDCVSQQLQQLLRRPGGALGGATSKHLTQLHTLHLAQTFAPGFASRRASVDTSAPAPASLLTAAPPSQAVDSAVALAGLASACEAATLSAPVYCSPFQRAVGGHLQQLGLAHKMEHVTEFGVSVDIAWPAQRAALLVDGPSHFFMGTKSHTPSSKLQQEVLQGAGWSVTRIPYFEWNRVRQSPHRVADYLRQRAPQPTAGGLRYGRRGAST